MFSTRLQLAAASGTSLRSCATCFSNRARTASGSSTAQKTRHSLRWLKNERLLRRFCNGCGCERKLAWRNRAPVSKLIAPVWILRQSRLTERDPVLRLVPITRIRDQSHRHGRSNIYRRADETAGPVLWKWRNRELCADQRRTAQRMWETYFRQVTPRPLALVRAQIFSEHGNRFVVTRAHQVAV